MVGCQSVVGAGAALLLAACGASGGSPSPSAAAPSPSTEGVGPAGEAYEVDTATDAKLGTILVGEDGKTLYIFKKDSGGKSACNGDCAAKWPPFVLEAGRDRDRR